MKCLNILAFFLVIIAALNWGLWGFFQFDFIAWLCHGNTNWMSRFIYAIIGLAGLWSLRFIPHCKHICCDMEKCCSDKDKGGSCKM